MARLAYPHAFDAIATGVWVGPTHISFCVHRSMLLCEAAVEVCRLSVFCVHHNGMPLAVQPSRQTLQGADPAIGARRDRIQRPRADACQRLSCCACSARAVAGLLQPRWAAVGAWLALDAYVRVIRIQKPPEQCDTTSSHFLKAATQVGYTINVQMLSMLYTCGEPECLLKLMFSIEWFCGCKTALSHLRPPCGRAFSVRVFSADNCFGQ